MMDLGHLGSGLTLKVTGLDAFKMICRPDLEVAHTVSTALVSSDLIGAWPQAPSQSVKGGVIMYRRGGGERPGVALQNRTTRRLL